jgi:hypothetical protein
MTVDRVFVLDCNGRSVAFVCEHDVVMRAGLDNDRDLKRAVSQLTGKPIREYVMDHKPGRSRPIKCFGCNRFFSPDQKIEERFGVPYHDAGWRKFHEACLA